MTRNQTFAIARKSAQEIVKQSLPPGEENSKLVLAVEQALSLEWWRGYHTAKNEH